MTLTEEIKDKTKLYFLESGFCSEWAEAINMADDLADFCKNLLDRHHEEISYLKSDLNRMKCEVLSLDEEVESLTDALQESKDKVIRELLDQAGVQLDPYNYLDREKIVLALKNAANQPFSLMQA